MISRRNLIVLGVGGAALATGVRALDDVLAVRKALVSAFGSDVANTKAADAFARDYQMKVLAGARTPDPETMVRAFLQSTNFVDHYYADAELSYDGLYDAREQTCGNRLSALYAPDGEHADALPT